MKIKKKDLILTIIITILLILFDQITKIFFKSILTVNQVVNVIPNFFYFTLVFNTGAAFSSFSSSTVFLLILSIIGFIVALYFSKNNDFTKKKVYTISLIFIMAGTFGNLIDRFLTTINVYPGVVDFIGLTFFSYDFAIFNIADMLLVIGIIMLGIDIIFLEDKRKKKENENNK